MLRAGKRPAIACRVDGETDLGLACIIRECIGVGRGGRGERAHRGGRKE